MVYVKVQIIFVVLFSKCIKYIYMRRYYFIYAFSTMRNHVYLRTGLADGGQCTHIDFHLEISIVSD